MAEAIYGRVVPYGEFPIGQRVEACVPMPDFMREQMPALMPKVMASLMPHMIGEVVPLVTQPMIDYLRGKS